jgi:hypothetical protein
MSHGGWVMAISRTVPNKAAQKKLIHSLKEVADDLITFVTDLQRVRELVEQTSKAGKQYTQPLDSWIWYWVYCLTRTRKPDVLALVATLNQSGSSSTLLAAINNFFSVGGWESTSVNTNLMYELLGKLPGYSDMDPRTSLSVENIFELKELFLDRAAQILQPERFAEVKSSEAREAEMKLQHKRQTELKLELEQLAHQQHIRQTTAELQGQFAQIKNKKDSDDSSVKKLDLNQFTAVTNTLEAMFKKRIDEFKQKEEAMRTVKKLDPELVQSVAEKLGAVLQKQAATIKASGPHAEKFNDSYSRLDKLLDTEELAPASSPTLSAAAFAATEDKYKNETQTYSAPPRSRLQLNNEQLQAMNRLFGGRAAVRDEKEECVETPSIRA